MFIKFMCSHLSGSSPRKFYCLIRCPDTSLIQQRNLSYQGQVKIHFHVLDQTRNITLNAKNLTIDQSRVTLSSQSGNKCIVNAELNEDKEFYILHLCEVLQQTVKYELNIAFKGPLNSNDTGYYWSSFHESLTNQTR